MNTKHSKRLVTGELTRPEWPMIHMRQVISREMCTALLFRDRMKSRKESGFSRLCRAGPFLVRFKLTVNFDPPAGWTCLALSHFWIDWPGRIFGPTFFGTFVRSSSFEGPSGQVENVQVSRGRFQNKAENQKNHSKVPKTVPNFGSRFFEEKNS